MDYTIANIDIKNDNKNTICLDTKQGEQTLYLYDYNYVKYSALLNEIAEERLIVYRNMKNNINIKFNKVYNPEREIAGLVFTDIVLNYEEYINKTEEKSRISIIVE